MRRQTWLVALLVLAITALGLRILNLLDLWNTLPFQVVIGDAKQYDQWAQRIVAGEWLGTDVFYQTPLYPYFLACTFKLFGHDLFIVRMIQACFGAIGTVLVALAARRFFGERAGLCAGFLVALYAPAIFFDGLIQKASLDFVLVALAVFLIGEYSARRTASHLVLLGFVVGIFTLNRENARVLFPVVIAWLVIPIRWPEWKTSLGRVLLFGIPAVLLLLPVAVRNYYVGGEFLISTSQLGPNFYIGNHAGAHGGYEELSLYRGNASHEKDDATELAEQVVGRRLSPTEVSNYWLQRSWTFIRSEPTAWFVLLCKKFLLSVNNAELADTESLEAYAQYSRVIWALKWFGFGVLLPLAALGIWLTRARWRALTILYAMLMAIPASVALFFVLARYRFPMVPIAAVFGGVTVSALIDAFKTRAAIRDRVSGQERTADIEPASAVVVSRRDWARGLPVLLVAIGLTRAPVVPAFIDQTNLNVGAELVGLGRAAEGLPFLEAAANDEPTFAPNRYNLGLAYYRLHRTGEAQLEFDTALRSRPDYVEAHNALGILLLENREAARAVDSFRRAVQLKPTSAQLYRNLGDALTAVGGRMSDSIEAYERSLKLAPDSLPTLYKLAVAYAEIGRTSAAVESLQRALAIAKKNNSVAEAVRINKAIDSLRTKPR